MNHTHEVGEIAHIFNRVSGHSRLSRVDFNKFFFLELVQHALQQAEAQEAGDEKEGQRTGSRVGVPSRDQGKN